MNRILIILISVFFTFCKKDYTCTCTWQGQVVTVSRGQYKTIGKFTKKDAQKECAREQNETNWAVSPVVCEFK